MNASIACARDNHTKDEDHAVKQSTAVLAQIRFKRGEIREATQMLEEIFKAQNTHHFSRI